ncbi:hypothetical protein HMI54_008107, partial [Coelomomyces lativittatus]
LLWYLTQRTQCQFTPLYISAIQRASDILQYEPTLNHREKVTLHPVSEYFLKVSQEDTWPKNITFVPYNHQLRKLNRQLY